MNKSELVSAIATDTKLTKKDVEAVVKSFIDNVSKSLEKGDDVQLIGFGTFETSERAARSGRNPRTGAELKIKASTVARFKPKFTSAAVKGRQRSFFQMPAKSLNILRSLLAPME